MKTQKTWQVALIIACLVAVWVFSQKRDAKTSVPLSFQKATSTKEEVLIRPKPTYTPQAVAPEQKTQQSENYKSAAQNLKSCFGISGNIEIREPGLEAWKNLISSTLGEVTSQAEEWRNTHVVLPNGEQRRIHLEVENNDQGLPVLKLKYAGVDKEDLPVPIELPREQSENPSPTFLASLENEGKITLFEISEKWKLSENGEVSVIERNGIVNEIEITKNGKSFRCNQLESSQGHCDCL
jgi:hypothetical protein